MQRICEPGYAAPAHTDASLAKPPPSAYPVATILAGHAPPETFVITCGAMSAPTQQQCQLSQLSALPGTILAENKLEDPIWDKIFNAILLHP